MTLYKWSQTAAADATADSTINWAEGQAPSSVNDSARGMMVATAKYRDDVAGAIVTSGTNISYTVSSYQIFDTLAHLNGQMIAFTPHITNGAIATVLNVDGLGAKPLRTSPGVELLAGMLIQGTPYVATYNNTDGAFYLRGYLNNPFNIPLGAGLDYWGTTAPNSCFAFAAGQALSRIAFAPLFALFGTTYGTGDGSTTFNIPDVRGRVIAAMDNMAGNAANRLSLAYFGVSSGYAPTSLGAYGGSEQRTLVTSNLPPYTPQGYITNGTITSNYLGVSGYTAVVVQGSAPVASGAGTQTFTQQPSSFSGYAQGGSSTPFPSVQPTIVSNYILRVA